MRFLMTALVLAGLSGPVSAGHDLGIPPGKAAMTGIDRNKDGMTNGKDYAPGQSAAEPRAVDINMDGKKNGADYAPGQIRHNHED